MKDIAIQVNILGFVFVLNSIAFTFFITSRVRGVRRVIANLVWTIVPLSVIVHSFYLNLWSRFWFSVFGLILHMKILGALSWMIFHLFAIFVKVHYVRRWRGEKSKAVRDGEIRDGIERRLLTMLHLMHSLARYEANANQYRSINR